jgi:SAM-dependent methyltransferase
VTDGLKGRALWDAHAHADPLWAVLSNPGKKGRWTLRAFMQNGEREIARMLDHLRQLQLPAPRGPVLDFGCGVGRLTQAFARRFDDVTGADISPAMIALAERINQYPDRARYVCTADAGLAAVRPRQFGFIYSNIVLQHVDPALAVEYLGGLIGMLTRGGMLVFQLPSHRAWEGQLEAVAMAADAYRASLSLADPAPAAAAPGSEIAIRVKVRNDSTRTWSQPGAGPLAAGNHWLDAGGDMVRQDDGRAPLPQMLGSGAECRLLLTMQAPSAPGRYIAEIDVVHEGVSWFGWKGSPTLRVPIEVAAGASDPAAAGDLAIPEYSEHAVAPTESGPSSGVEPFPMNAVPRDEVLAAVRRHGATLRHVEEDQHAGPDWISYTYYVQAE